MSKKVVIVGAGIAGLAAACRAAVNGHSVTLLEKNDVLGGKISTVEKDGFTWDGGPSFFTDPQELTRLFTDCGLNYEDYFSWIDLDEACRYFYKNEIVHGYDTPEKLAEELERAFQEPKEHTIRFLGDVAKLYNLAGQQFLNEPVSMKSMLSPRTLNSIRHLPKHSLFSTLHEMHQRYFENDKVVQFFDRFATYVGGDAYRTPGMLMAMPHLEHNQGAVQPIGGMRRIIESTVRLAENLGVDIKTGQEVTSVIVENGVIKNIITKNENYATDVVINAGDIANFYKFVNSDRHEKHIKKEHSLSAYVQYLGVEGKTKNLYLHNILFSDDYAAETKALWSGEVYGDPTIYINNTSLYEPKDAPKNCENWFIMVNVPSGFDSNKLPMLQVVISKKLEKHFPGITKRTKTQAESLTPYSLEQKYKSYKGSIYGIAANSIRGSFLRPKNKDTKFKNLYHVGVTVHPGGGIPLALRSARIVSKMIG